MCVFVRTCVRTYVRACVRVYLCVSACVCARVCARAYTLTVSVCAKKKKRECTLLTFNFLLLTHC